MCCKVKGYVLKGHEMSNITPCKMNENATINIGKVAVLKRLHEKVEELSDAMKELGKPILEDLSLLPKIYDAYKEVFKRQGRFDTKSVRNRKKFLFVVLYLYSPQSLVGISIRRGLRKKMSELFGLTTSSTISDNCVGLLVLYHAYADFRRDVNLIFQEVLTTLDDEIILTV